ncbi:hypothetical protein MNV49_000690 [Pseudohyphozyma bogoriensis]|nr:hypothetical protein MNV49_000690 [Pseudohyphozyma bogoriensis]
MSLTDSLFESYESDLSTLVSSVQTKISSDAREQRGDSRKALFGRIERELEEADEIMEIEVQTTTEDKAVLQGKLKEFKATLQRQKVELRNLMATADRDDLLSTSSAPHVTLDMERSDSDSGPSTAQQQRMLSMTDKLSDGQRRLEESHRVALETEDLGAGILRDLRGQRDVLEHTRDHLYEADGGIDRASNTIHKMVRRMYQQRLVTYAIIVILVLLILYVLFAKIF